MIDGKIILNEKYINDQTLGLELYADDEEIELDIEPVLYLMEDKFLDMMGNEIDADYKWLEFPYYKVKRS